MQPTYTARRDFERGGVRHFAEVTVRAQPCDGPTEVILSPVVLDRLRTLFGPEFDHHRHCVWAAVIAQIDTANVKGDFPFAGTTSFWAEVVDVNYSGDAGREISGALASMAGMEAIGEYLNDWENEQTQAQGLA